MVMRSLGRYGKILENTIILLVMMRMMMKLRLVRLLRMIFSFSQI
jgi:hypothetical protein